MEQHIYVYHGGEINESRHCMCHSLEIPENIVMLQNRHSSSVQQGVRFQFMSIPGT
jgi:hypothetical protein